MSRIGFTFSKTSALPPTMIASVPSMALGSPPETGASSISTPFWRQCRRDLLGRQRRDGAHVDEDGARRAPSITPFGPSTTSFTCGELGSMVMMSSPCAATSSGEAPGFAPASTRASSTGRRHDVVDHQLGSRPSGGSWPWACP